MKYLAVLAIVLAMLAGVAGAAAEQADGTLSRRMRAILVSVDTPDFPSALARDAQLEVLVRFEVDASGNAHAIRVIGPAGPADEAVIDAVRRWVIVPPVCAPRFQRPEVRVRVVFERQGDRKFVEFKDAAWFAVAGTPGGQEKVNAIHRVDPDFPRYLVRKGVSRGFAQVLLAVAPDGKAQGIEGLFTWPGTVFEASTREALMQWRFADAEGKPPGRPLRVCIDVKFSLKD